MPVWVLGGRKGWAPRGELSGEHLGRALLALTAQDPTVAPGQGSLWGDEQKCRDMGRAQPPWVEWPQ